MSQASSSHEFDFHRKVVTVRKMDGSEFQVVGLSLSRVRVSDLKKLIEVQEHIREDTFDLSSGDVVLNSPELLNRSLKDAGILDTVSLTMKKTDPYCPETNQCTVCKSPHSDWQVMPVCRDCHYRQLCLMQRVLGRRSAQAPRSDDDDNESDCEYE